MEPSLYETLMLDVRNANHPFLRWAHEERNFDARTMTFVAGAPTRFRLWGMRIVQYVASGDVPIEIFMPETMHRPFVANLTFAPVLVHKAAHIGTCTKLPRWAHCGGAPLRAHGSVLVAQNALYITMLDESLISLWSLDSDEMIVVYVQHAEPFGWYVRRKDDVILKEALSDEIVELIVRNEYREDDIYA